LNNVLDAKLPYEDLNWINYLKLIQSNHSYNEAKTFVHQYYLPFIENFNLNKLDYLAYFLFYKKIEEAHYVLNKNTSIRNKILDYHAYVVQSVYKINDAKSMLYDDRKSVNKYKKAVINNYVNTHPHIIVVEFDAPVIKVVIGTLKINYTKLPYSIYENGYLIRKWTDTLGSNEIYYFRSNQIYRSW
jgi:hypothetical protein